MQEITNVKDISNFITDIKIKRKGFISNMFLSEEKLNIYISEHRLFFVKEENTYFIFFKIHDYYRLYYFSINYDELNKSLNKLVLPKNIIVCELLGKNGLENECNVLENNKFKKYSTIINFSKKNKNINTDEMVFPECIRYAKQEDYTAIKTILFDLFNRFIDINMTVEEIKYNIDKQNVIVVENENQEVIGFAIYSITNGKGFTNISGIKPEYKQTLYGKILYMTLNELYTHSAFTSLFVREDNDYLMNYYKKLKYTETGLVSIIYYIENGDDKITAIKPMN